MRGKDSKYFNKTLIRNTRTVCETDIHKVIKNCAKSIVGIVQSVMMMIIQSVYTVLIMLRLNSGIRNRHNFFPSAIFLFLKAGKESVNHADSRDIKIFV